MELLDISNLGPYFDRFFSSEIFIASLNKAFVGQPAEWLTAAGSSFSLVATAEIGDKSQVVCMSLAARYHRTTPVLMGAIAAFAILNLIAVVFGTAVATWIPEKYLMSGVAVLFALFGVHALRARHDDSDQTLALGSRQNLFITTFLLISVAEFGDKTQLAVAGLSSTMIPASVWAGATFALITTTVIGVWAGTSALRRVPIIQIHRISGIFFLGFALAAVYQLFAL